MVCVVHVSSSENEAKNIKLTLEISLIELSFNFRLVIGSIEKTEDWRRSLTRRVCLIDRGGSYLLAPTSKRDTSYAVWT